MREAVQINLALWGIITCLPIKAAQSIGLAFLEPSARTSSRLGENAGAA
jgi:hypothetical protein